MQIFFKQVSNRLHLLNSYLRGLDSSVAGPLDVLAEVTSHCNLSCPECRRMELVDKPTHMKWSVFESILRSGSGHLELAFLFGWGEPLLWPDLFEGIMFARKLRIRTSVSTNITMLKGDLAEKMSECPPDILTLALDSHVKEVYEHYRKGADFDQVYRNLQEFVQLSKKKKSSAHVVLQMISSPEASKTAGEYKSFAKQFPHTDIRYRRYKPAKSIALGPSKHRPCPILWRGPAYVRADGQVFPCCILVDQPLGNILDSDLNTLWNSKKMKLLRQMHSNGRINELKECSTCYHSDAHEYSMLTAAAGFLWNSYWVRRMIPFSEKLLLLKNRIISVFNRIAF